MTSKLPDLARLRADLNRLREERGATDPILIIAGIAITLILLVGGSFAVSGFIANANNLNAKGDLDRIATAQAAYMTERDSYGALRVNIPTGATTTTLQNSTLGFTPTAGLPIISTGFGTGGTAGWGAVVKSASGEVFVRLSTSTTIFSLGTGPNLPDPLPAGLQTQATSMGGAAWSWVQNAFDRVNGN
jgi:hypothetical protein